MKTASRILGRAFFLEGFEVQDAPRYGAERRGAPIFAYVRASTGTINERGIIHHPDLIVVADDSLIALPAAEVLTGITPATVLLLYSNTDAATWQNRLNLHNPVLILPAGQEAEDPLLRRYAGASCAGATARLTGVISGSNIEKAIDEELIGHDIAVVNANRQHAAAAYETMHDHQGIVQQGKPINAQSFSPPQWIDFPFERAAVSAPAIHGAATSEALKTGLWRTMRPIIAYERCNRCWWVCSTFCPDSAIKVTENRYPQIDYAHCKGCMVCVSQCPPHAITTIPEVDGEKTFIEEPPHET